MRAEVSASGASLSSNTVASGNIEYGVRYSAGSWFGGTWERIASRDWSVTSNSPSFSSGLSLDVDANLCALG